MSRAMEIGWAILKNYEPMAHFESAKPLQNDRNPNDPSSGKFGPTMSRAKRPLTLNLDQNHISEHWVGK